ncbi:MAG: ribonuclease P protein component [Chloroflexi bacterium]|nr:ribonuclease P protein component [Chloroflexota bacterium]
MAVKYCGSGDSRAARGLPSEAHPSLQSEHTHSASFAFPRERRLRRASDFQAIRNGKSWANAVLVLRCRSNGLDITRFGFSVGKRVGNAVRRNQVKRRLREFARQQPLKPGWDVLIIARPAAAHLTYAQLGDAARRLMERAGLLLPQDTGDNP